MQLSPPANYRATLCAADQKQVEAAFLQWHKSKKYLIFIGNYIRQALRNFQRLARFQKFIEKFAIPVMTTLDGKGTFLESHSYSLHNYGFVACEWSVQYLKALSENGENDYDCLMVLGSVLGQLSTVAITNGQRINWNRVLVPSKTFIKVDLAPYILCLSPSMLNCCCFLARQWFFCKASVL